MSLQPQPLISVAIPTKNRAVCLTRLIASLLAQDHPAIELIVIDDGSDSPIANLPTQARILRHEKSRGACASRNAGLEMATGEFVAYFDDDAELPDTTTLSRAAAWLQARPRCGAVGFRQTDATGKTRGVNPSREGRPCLTSVFYTYGCLLRKSALRQLSGFAEPFRYYFEEVEFSLRLLDADFEIVYDPELRVIHYEDSEGRDWKQISRLNLRNATLTVLLNYPLPAVLPELARALRYTHRTFVQRVGLDLSGKMDAFLSALGEWRYVRDHRHALRAETLLRYRSLNRSPAPIDRPVSRDDFSFTRPNFTCRPTDFATADLMNR